MKKRTHALFHWTAPELSFPACLICHESQSSETPAHRAAGDRLSQHHGRARTAVHGSERRWPPEIQVEQQVAAQPEEPMRRALEEFDQISSANLSLKSRNFVTLATLVINAALWRTESRGGHFRRDFPDRDDAWKFHSVQKSDAPIARSKSVTGFSE